MHHQSVNKLTRILAHFKKAANIFSGFFWEIYFDSLLKSYFLLWIIGMDKTILQQKMRAFSIHIVISSMLAVLMYVIVFKFLYPSPLDIIEGVLPIFLMMLSIDLVLGPIFTFIVYKKDKKTLKMDLALIGLVQLAGLCYGLYSLYITRPSFIVFETDKFVLVNANDVVTHPNPKYPVRSHGVQYVAANFSGQTQADVVDFVKDSVINGKKIEYEQKFYNELKTVQSTILKKAKPLTELNSSNDKQVVENAIKSYPNFDSYLPLETFGKNAVVLLNRNNINKGMQVVNLQP